MSCTADTTQWALDKLCDGARRSCGRCSPIGHPVMYASTSIEICALDKLVHLITADNIGKAGSKARNPLIAQNLREFPVAPNIEAGESVKIMFVEMSAVQLYPPQYSQHMGAAVESVTVTLLNLERPSAWDEVSEWIDRHGSIQNAKLCEIAKMDTLKASKLLTAWRQQGLLVSLPDRAKKNMAYTKPAKTDEQPTLFSDVEDNKS